MAKRIYTDGEINLLNEAFEKLLRLVGVREGLFSQFFSDSVSSEIDAPKTLYVETTGDDGNPGSQLKPFKTIQAAVDSLKGLTLKALVTIQIGAGTFAGAVVRNVEFENNNDQVGGLLITGTWAEPTLTTGTTSGTLTAALPYSTMPNYVEDNTQNWTANELRGKFIKFNRASNGDPYWIPITGNTATRVYVAQVSFMAINDSYTILEPATLISNAAAFKTGRAATQKGSAGTALAGFVIDTGITIDYLSRNLIITGLKFVDTGNWYQMWIGSLTRIESCKFESSTIYGGVRLTDSAYFYNCSFSNSSSGSGINTDSFENPYINGCYFYGTGTKNGKGITSTARIYGLNYNSFYNLDAGLYCYGPGGSITGAANIFDTCARAIVLNGTSSSGAWLPCRVQIDMIGNGTTTAINCDIIADVGPGGTLTLQLGASTTGNTTGIRMYRGGECFFYGSVIGSATEFNLDGTPETIVNLDAAAGRILTSAAGSAVKRTS